MKVRQLIAHLNTLRPDDDIIVQYYLADHFETFAGPPHHHPLVDPVILQQAFSMLAGDVDGIPGVWDNQDEVFNSHMDAYIKDVIGMNEPPVCSACNCTVPVDEEGDAQ